MWKPPAFRVETGGRLFEVPFLPAELARRIERQCDFRWYDYVLQAILLPFAKWP